MGKCNGIILKYEFGKRFNYSASKLLHMMDFGNLTSQTAVLLSFSD
jgi:hypothetical protein